ncbi:MAG: sulfate permease [Gammaproteobacteria bacterium]|nr:sulfate permease [Gammaproteobacteria bacterium]MCW8910456.1 sulfate permease [Gammaproteobacteria bacterium]MCW9004964.1 sulfate permease [Gammaproteobacteria bacterium]MCW9056941.1 sulfate permease [Gammaproteobacteria bacterium]
MAKKKKSVKLKYKIFPFLEWLPMLKDSNVLRADIIAGLTVALVLIPQSMAYAQLAGLPAYFGLYIAFMPVMVAALWGSSKQLATGPVAVVSLMSATALATMVGGVALDNPDPEIVSRYIALAMLLTLIVGLFQFCLGFFKLGVIVNFLSHPVIVGFTNAAALVIGLSQLSKIFGVSMPGAAGDHFLTVRIWGVLQQLGDTHMLTFIMGMGAFAVMFLMKKYTPKIPGVLVAVVATTIISYMIGFQQRGGGVVGEIPEGLPEFAVPAFNMADFWVLLPSAMIISLVGFMEAISIAKAMAAKTKDRIDPNQELIGQGMGNIVGSFFQSYPSSGSFSRSAVNLNAGAITGFSSVVTAMVVLVTLLFLTPLLYHLPKAVLAAVIMMAVFGLINFGAVKHAWRANIHDGIASIVTFVCTLGFAPHLDKGILIGAGLALGLYLYRTMKPRVAMLGRYPDGTLRDLQVNPDLLRDEQVVVLRFDGSLYFANVSYFEDIILEAVSENQNAKYILVVGDGINQLDASGEEVVHHLIERLRSNDITLVFSGLKKQILDVMRCTYLFEHLGQENFFATEDMALVDIYRRLGKEGEDAVLLPSPA